ncbi:hypothetical protein BDY21DRAFT_355143 [Lineolata rhizophorae]|uniref:Uncharacterized protein n=1 Tax=Lineolata rhizophorae TaxID=578093 RepID=A0A6A6NQY2_9PEZI|nr:hypothetical protein BDY21DRAFT_355143 [Lineolata rhizophorae]
MEAIKNFFVTQNSKGKCRKMRKCDVQCFRTKWRLYRCESKVAWYQVICIVYRGDLCPK